ncbi:hypothetical protein GCM10027404_20250 [Arthrobacter tumbae]
MQGRRFEPAALHLRAVSSGYTLHAAQVTRAACVTRHTARVIRPRPVTPHTARAAPWVPAR